jgi:hypothetical protein
VPFASKPLARAGVCRGLSIGARRQRSRHRGPDLPAIQARAVARHSGGRERVSVHRDPCRAAPADIPRPVCRERAVWRGAADHDLALYALARRVPAAADRLRVDEGASGRPREPALARLLRQALAAAPASVAQ